MSVQPPMFRKAYSCRKTNIAGKAQHSMGCSSGFLLSFHFLPIFSYVRKRSLLSQLLVLTFPGI